MPHCHGNMNRWMDGQVMTFLGGQLGPGKGSDGLQFASCGDVVLLGSRLNLEKLLSRQALDWGPLCSQTPLLSGMLDCHAPQGCTCSLPSGVRHPGSSQTDCDSPLSSSERAAGVVLGLGFPGVLGKRSAGCALVGVLPTLPKSPIISPFPMLQTLP